MSYKVKLEHHSFFEMMTSLGVFGKKGYSRFLSLGDQWAKEVKAEISPELQHKIFGFNGDLFLWIGYTIVLYLKKKPNDERAFLEWFLSLTPGQLFDEIHPYLCKPFESDIGEVKDHFIKLLMEWNEQYFDEKSEELAKEIKVAAEEKRHLLERLTDEEFIEEVSPGFWYDPSIEKSSEFLMIPSFHLNPLCIEIDLNDTKIMLFPIDYTKDTAFPADLQRIIKALSEDRLKILRYISDIPKSFTDITSYINLSKSTIHQHMVLLRAAGLIRFDVYKGLYSLRQQTFLSIQEKLTSYVLIDTKK
jgi:DNA-binding transcriptional ArsR family regulator